MSRLSQIPASVLDLASVRVGDTPRDAFSRSVQLAQHAEALGYKRYWLAEHHNSDGIASSAPAVIIGHVADNTEKIRVGSGGVMLPNHAPLVIAEQFGTLESLHPGRIDLGLGRAPGTDPMTARALRRSTHQTANDFPELLSELQKYFSPEPGQVVKAFPGSGLDVPIWILGSSTYSAALAADLGLPFAFASHFAPEELMTAAHIYRDRFRPNTTSPNALKAPYMMVTLGVIIAETDLEAQRLLTTGYQRFLALTRGESMKMRPPVDSMEGLWNEAEKAMVRGRFALSCVGSTSTVERKLESILDATKADELMVVCDVFDQEDRLYSYEQLAQLRHAPQPVSV